MTTEIIIIVLLILANALFAMAEFAIVSARKTRLQQRAQNGDIGARAALKLASAPNRFLSTIQVSITLIGIFAGAFGGATIAERIAEKLNYIEFISPYSQGIALVIVVLFITFFTLVIGELVPKRLALNHAEAIASKLAIPLSKLSVFASPINWLLSVSTDTILGLFGSKNLIKPLITEEDIRLLIAQGTKTGEFEEVEQDMITGVFRLGNLKIEALTTPRKEIVWLNIKDSPEENWQKILSSRHSHFPVCRDKLDNILGVFYIKDLWSQKDSKQSLDLKSLYKQPLFIPESILALKVLELFKKSGIHFALVIDEYGGCQGVVTLKDILEAIVGEMPELGESTEPNSIQLEDGSWLLDGMVLTDEFKKIFHIQNLPEEKHYHTLGGFVMKQMGHIPSIGESFEWNGFTFKIKTMDGHRVDRIQIIKNK